MSTRLEAHDIEGRRYVAAPRIQMYNAPVKEHAPFAQEPPLSVWLSHQPGALRVRRSRAPKQDNSKKEMTMHFIAIAIARVTHEANRAYCQALGDDSQVVWEDAPEWQRESAINGVKFHLANPSAGPEQSHESWLAEKEAAGWKYGPVKDPEAKEHPCFVPYNELPVEQRAKDYIFRAIVHALA